jgi:hypothetical protein
MLNSAMDEKNKKRANAYNRLGDNYLRADLLDEAAAAYSKAINYDPTFSTPYNSLGIVYIDQKKYNEAIESFKNAILLDPGEALYYANLGTAYSEVGMSDVALEANLAAIEANPKDYFGHFNLGCCYQSRGKFKAALEHNHIRVTHLKGTVKRKKLSCGEKRKFLAEPFGYLHHLPLPQFHSVSVSVLDCTSHPSGLRSLVKRFIHGPFRLLADQKIFGSMPCPNICTSLMVVNQPQNSSRHGQ